MDEDGIRDLIKDVARHGEGIGIDASGADIRRRGDLLKSRTTFRRDRRSETGRRPFGHSAAIAWFLGVAALLIGVVVFVGVPGSRPSNSRADATTTSTTSPKPTTTTNPAPVGPSQSQSALARAVATTDSAGNFDLSFVLSGGSGLDADGMTGSGAANLAPIAMTLNHVAGATLSFGPDNAWEQLGGPGWQEYTIPAFSTYAENVVGTTAGALGTFSFCSPTGLFDLTESSIGPTTEVGTATVDGQATTEYAVTIDPSSFLAAPGITPGEAQAMQSAIGLLGGGPILDDVYINAGGDIVRTVSSIDGASLQVDLSNFGNAGTVTLPPQQSSIDSSTTLPNGVEGVCSGSGPSTTIGSAVTTTTVPNPSTTDTTLLCTSSSHGSSSPLTTIPPPSSTATTAVSGS
ncbi:MAG: hypothetical protein ACLP6E_11600 [Acidimicrobiales bacterium]